MGGEVEYLACSIIWHLENREFLISTVTFER
jgi:hypothetical protein